MAFVGTTGGEAFRGTSAVGCVLQVARRSVVPVLLAVCYRWRGVPWYQCCWLCELRYGLRGSLFSFHLGP